MLCYVILWSLDLSLEILDLGRMVTNILSNLKICRLQKLLYKLYPGVLASLSIARGETSAPVASTAATATAYPAFAAVTIVYLLQSTCL